jgi:isomaltose glucohydrolase
VGTKTAELGRLAERSVAIIREGQTASGAYLACPAFPPYRFCWFRDGAFIADAMSTAGEAASAEAFFRWCSDVVLARRERVASGEHLHARYTADGREADVEWPTFQLDGFGIWLWALRRHECRHGSSLDPYREAADLTAAYLASRWREPCTDWWEERVGLHPATLASIHAGLAAFEHPEAEAVKAAVRLEEAALDASLIACATPFGVVEPDAFAPILADVEAELVSPGGGVHRHPEDVYYGGGEWLLLTALLGLHYAELGRTDEAAEKLAWVAAHAEEDGALPEQSQDHLLSPDTYQEWVEKWGPPPSPLLWSHAMFLLLADRLANSE